MAQDNTYYIANEIESHGQRTIDGQILEEKRDGPFGDNPEKHRNHIRISTQNVHGKPKSKQSLKNYQMKPILFTVLNILIMNTLLLVFQKLMMMISIQNQISQLL